MQLTVILCSSESLVSTATTRGSMRPGLMSATPSLSRAMFLFCSSAWASASGRRRCRRGRTGRSTGAPGALAPRSGRRGGLGVSAGRGARVGRVGACFVAGVPAPWACGRVRGPPPSAGRARGRLRRGLVRPGPRRRGGRGLRRVGRRLRRGATPAAGAGAVAGAAGCTAAATPVRRRSRPRVPAGAAEPATARRAGCRPPSIFGRFTRLSTSLTAPVPWITPARCAP